MKCLHVICFFLITLLTSCTDDPVSSGSSPDEEVTPKLTISAITPSFNSISLRGAFQVSGIQRSNCKIYYFHDKDSVKVAEARTKFLENGSVLRFKSVDYPSNDAQFTFRIVGLHSYESYYMFFAIVNVSDVQSSFKSIYSEVCSFKTTTALSISLLNATKVSDTSVELLCSIIRQGEFPILEAGVCYGANVNPTIQNSKTVNEIIQNSFKLTLQGLASGVSYNIRPYATMEIGTVYGNIVPFPFKEHIVTFDPNGGVGEMPHQIYYQGLKQRLSPQIFDRKGYWFIGWSSSQKGKVNYMDKADISISKDMSLFAQWKRDTNAIVSDANENEYSVVRIGNQLWTKDNWKCSKYADGTPISQVKDSKQWAEYEQGAYCSYENGGQGSEDHGILYNWYAVSSGKLAPEGWRVPSDEDWKILEDYLITNGYNYDGSTLVNKLAKSLAEVNNPNLLWEHSDGNGAVGNVNHYLVKNNSSGFSALPSGCRNEFGKYLHWGHHGYWWSLSEFDNSYASNRIIGYYNYSLNKGRYHKKSGFSVRLVKDVTPSTPSQ